MEMDCNLNFFLCIVEKSLKLDYRFFFLGEIPKYFLPDVLIVISCYIKGSLSNIREVLTKILQNPLDSAPFSRKIKIMQDPKKSKFTGQIEFIYSNMG